MMKKHRRIRFDRRGAALEMAIFMMAFVFALSALIVTLTYYIKMSGSHAADLFCRRVETESIGERFVSCEDRNNFTLGDDSENKYRIKTESSAGCDILEVFDRESGKLELTVKVKDGKIVAWSYSEKDGGE